MSRVGTISGAYIGEWFDGSSSVLAAISSTVAAPSKRAGSAPPRIQKTHGAPAAVARTPTSSLPVTRPGSTTIRETASKAGWVKSAASGSFTTAGNEAPRVISGSRGAPAATASPRTMRSMAASTRVRTSAPVVRMLTWSSARSGMMFAADPACRLPTVMTALSVPASSRDTMVCSREGGAVTQADDPCRERTDMLPEYDGRPVEPLEEAVVDHGLCSGAQLLCRLEDGDERPGPRAGVRRQNGTRAQQAGDVHVVPARMHEGHLGAG